MKVIAILVLAFVTSLIISFPLLSQTRQPEIKTGGYVQVRYTTDEDATDEFKIRRTRLKFSGDFANDISFLVLVDAVTTPILWKAHIDFAYRPWASLRIGQFKTPFSHEYLVSSSKLSTIDRSQVVSKLATKYDVGLQVSGSFSVLNYAVGVFNGAGKNTSDENEHKDAVGMIVASPIKEIEVGLSHYRGKSGTAKQKKDRTEAYVASRHGSFSLDGEYIFAKDSSTEKDGWYAQLAYKMIPELQALVRYDTYDPDKDLSGDRLNIVIVGLNWLIQKNAKLQVNYLLKDDGENSDTLFAQIQTDF